MAKTKVDDSNVSVNIADFQRTRDSVIVALATLQSSVHELSRAYINHANTVLAPGKTSAIEPNLTQVLNDSGLLTGGVVQPLPAIENPEEGKKKRKRVPHDPYAPKRALTPYFLYMQHARSQIHKELGDQARPKEVADEGTRRWTEMSPAEKSIWDDKYQKNLAAYRVRMTAYKTGQPVPSDEEALRLVEAGKAPETVPDVDVAEESEEDAAAAQVAPVAETSPETSPEPEPEPEPSPPKSKRRKSEKAKVEETPKETPKAKAKDRKTKKEVTPPPAKTASEKRKKTRKG